MWFLKFNSSVKNEFEVKFKISLTSVYFSFTQWNSMGQIVYLSMCGDEWDGEPIISSTGESWISANTQQSVHIEITIKRLDHWLYVKAAMEVK